MKKSAHFEAIETALIFSVTSYSLMPDDEEVL